MNSQRVIGLVIHGMACVLYIVMNGFAVPIYKTLVGGLTSRGVAIGMGMYLIFYFFVFLNLVLVFIPRLAIKFGVAIFMMVSILIYLLPQYPVRAMAYCALAGGLTVSAILVTRALDAAVTRWRATQGVARL
ncbi:hypothetical protein [Pseudomonas prosekii]|uniref:Uncharacterized protein n=1 Tax=Pseudomonas prosekii TaxID=1148509 RepID=A0A1H1WIV6_9PSED|nr:hypothetical protein [Pseudomonas prosekii]SDS97063.1 hypothetical protein SAMN05216222_2757 [Pseudomonas prosekii]